MSSRGYLRQFRRPSCYRPTMSSRHPAEVAFLQQLHDAVSAASPVPAVADDEVAHDVADAAAQMLPLVLEGEALDRAPLVGLFSLGRPGAGLVPVPHSDRSVVLVERQFPALAHLVAKALAAALPTREDERLEAFDELIDAHAERRGLYRAILEQDEELRPALAPVALLEPIMAQFWEQTVQALMAQGA